MPRSVRVTISGQRFSVRTDASPHYVRELATEVERHMESARSSRKTVTTQAQAVLAAMSLADELNQARRKEADLRRRVREKSKRILGYLNRDFLSE